MYMMNVLSPSHVCLRHWMNSNPYNAEILFFINQTLDDFRRHNFGRLMSILGLKRLNQYVQRPVFAGMTLTKVRKG